MPVHPRGHDHVAHHHVGQPGHVLHHQVVGARVREAAAARRRPRPPGSVRSCTPAPLSRSWSSCTLAALGPTATTRPSTPAGLITAASRATPRSPAAVEGEGAEPGHAVPGHDLGRHRLEGERLPQAQHLPQPVRLPRLVLPLLEQGLQVADLLLEALVRLVHAPEVDLAAPGRGDAPRGARERALAPERAG